MIAAIVLAAGASSRMGSDKLLLEVGGVSLLRRSARCAVDAAVGPVIVVLGGDAAETRAELDGLGCAVVTDPSLARRGMNASIAAGVAAVPGAAAGAVVILADMPFVTSASIRALVQRHRATGAPLVSTRYGETLAPPVLYDRALLGELAGGGDGDGIGRALLARHAGAVQVVDVAPNALDDVDEPAALERARVRMREGAEQ